MNCDPLREQIVDQLGRITDGNLFEACMCDLLRPEWPTLIPQPGGDDAGSDGTWVNADLSRGVLVATIQENVIGNVTRNLKQQIADGKTGRQVLVVTTRPLSARRCRNIEERIESLGFKVAHTPYTRQAIADRIYHNSPCLKRLLGITGAPPALSLMPKSHRPFRDMTSIGRESDLSWLRQTTGDVMLVGQPGIGKTFICRQYVKDGLALFATSDDEERLANAIRDQQPSTIIVEDAHFRLETVKALMALRSQLGTNFRMICDSWPGGAVRVRTALMLSNDQCRTLSLLSRKDIVAIIKEGGISGPPALLHRLVQQAMGLPGRAALLVHLCIQANDAQEVYDGSIIANWAYNTFQNLVGTRSTSILAGFAIGGDRGMTATAIAEVLGYSLGDLLTDLRNLAYGGVIHEPLPDTYCVLPEPLRSAIVRDQFFREVRLPLAPFLERAPEPASCVRALIRAYCIGADILPTDLFRYVQSCALDSVWESFIWADSECASLAINAHPELAMQNTGACLLHVPDIIVPQLLSAANGDHRELHSSPDHPLRQIHDWIKAAGPQSDCITRRRILWNHIRDFLVTREHQVVALKAFRSVITPSWEWHHQQADDLNSFTFQFGCLEPNALLEVAGIWNEAIQLLNSVMISHWGQLLQAIDEWIYPGRISAQISDEQGRVIDDTAAIILKAFASIGRSSPAFLSSLAERAVHFELDLDLMIDADYSVLFPSERKMNAENFRQVMETQAAAACSLADRWLAITPEDAAKKFLWCVAEAASLSHVYPDYSIVVAQHAAARTDKIDGWLRSMVDGGASSTLVTPFLNRVRETSDGKWHEWLRECQQHERLRFAVFQAVVDAEDCPVEFESDLNKSVKQFLPYVTSRISHGLLPVSRVKAMLESDDEEVSGKVVAALLNGEEYCDQPIPVELGTAWRRAAVFHQVPTHELGKVLRRDRALAFDWLNERLSNRIIESYRPDLISAACSSLDRPQTLSLLDVIDLKSWIASEFIASVGSSNAELYAEVLNRQALERLHLVPLRGSVNSQNWASLAIVAIEHAIPGEEIVAAAFQEVEATFGSLPSKYDKHALAWGELLLHNDVRIRQLAVLGKRNAESASTEWSRRENNIEFWHAYN